MSDLCKSSIYAVLAPSLKSHSPNRRLWPPVTHSSLFLSLKALSSIFYLMLLLTVPTSKTTTGAIALLDKTEPSSLRHAGPSKSNSSIRLFDAVMIRGSVGVNTKLKLGTADGDVRSVMSGTCGKLAADILCFSGVQINTPL
jgi:hypothetical protein